MSPPTRPALWATRLTTPGAGPFAVLFGLEAFGRALVTAALPIQSLELVGSDEGVSQLFLVGSVSALTMPFLVPRLVQWLGRARLCSLAILLLGGASALFLLHDLPTQVAGFVVRACAVAMLFSGLSMFIMEHVRRQELGRSEPLRMLSVGIGWTVGPALGVQVEAWFGPWAPFIASAAVALVMLIYFWALRLSNLPIVRAAPNQRTAVKRAPIAAYLAQPRLLLALIHAVGRGIFWGSFVIYTPLYAVSVGLGAATGGLLVSIGSGFMLLMPLWGWMSRRYGIRTISLAAFPIGAVSAFAAGFLGDAPWLGATAIVGAALAMSVADGYGNALFYRACKPSQRSTMTPIFAAQRAIGEIGQAALFAVLLGFLPIQAVFVTLGLVLFGLTLLATRIHRRL